MKYSVEELKKLEKYERKRGIDYFKFGSRKSRILLSVTYIIWLYMITMVLFYIAGYTLGIFEIGAPNYTWSASFITMLVTAGISLLMPIAYWVVAIVEHFNLRKKDSDYILLFSLNVTATKIIKLVTIAVNLITVPILFVQFIGLCRVDGIKLSSGSSYIREYDEGYFGLHKFFYWRHGVPMIIVLILIVVLFVLFFRERFIMHRERTKIAENEDNYKIIKDDE